MRVLYNKIFNRVRGPVALLLMLLCGALPSEASTETATRLYDSSKLELTRTAEADGSEYLHVSLPGLDRTATPGEPQLPVEYIRFLVPVYTKVTGVSAEARRTFPRTSNARVYPAQEPVTTSHEGPVDFTAPAAAAYSRNYPIRAEYVDDGFIDGCNHIVTVAVYPVGYSPAGGTLTAASEVTVTLEYENCTAAEMTSAPLFPPVRSRYLDLDAMVVNPSKTADRRYAPRVPALDDVREYYYIITPRNLKDAFTDLAVWKRQKGYNVIVKCIEDIYADPRYRINEEFHDPQNNRTDTILDSAMSLRCYLKDEFNAHGHFFCLLAGDWRTPMPIRKVTSGDSTIESGKIILTTNSGEYAVPSDVYFANLTQIHKLVRRSHMSIYSAIKDSIEFKYEISIGRLLCATPHEVQNYLHKLILYEGNPGYGDNDYLADALFFEGCNIEMDWKNNIEKHNGCLIGNSQIIRDKCDFFENISLYQDLCHTGKWQRTDYVDPSAITPEDPCGPSGGEIVKAMSKVGFSSWHGHGTPYGVLTGAWATFGHGYIMYSDNDLVGKAPYQDYKSSPNCALNNLTNKNKPSVVYSISCDNAPFDVFTWSEGEPNEFRFDKANLGRAFTTENLSGGPAALMNTRVGYIGSSRNIEDTFFMSIKKYPKLGLNLRETVKNSYKGNHCAMTLNLIGDPEFEMWLGKPKNFQIQLKPSGSGVSVEGDIQDETYYIISNMNNASARFPLTKNTISSLYPGEYCLSIWKTGYLPLITLFGQQGTLSESKRYVVREAVLGNRNETSIGYTIQADGILSVRAIDGISIYSGFTVENGGVAELACDQSVTINGGVVKKGGRLTIRAKDVKFNPGFKVETGGILNVEINNNN